MISKDEENQGTPTTTEVALSSVCPTIPHIHEREIAELREQELIK